MIKILACFLCAVFLFGVSGCEILSNSPKASKHAVASREPYTKRHYLDNIEHFDIPLEERSRDSFDKEAFLRAFFEFKDIIEAEYAEEKEERLFALYEEITSGLQDAKTDVSLARYDYFLDVKHSENAEFYAAKEDLYNSYYGKTIHLFRTVFATEYAAAFRAYIGDWLADTFLGSRRVSEEEKALKSKINELKQTYDMLLAQNAEDAAFQQLYIQIVNANNEYARLCGYDNYADYAYAEVFARDYTAEDVEAMEDEIRNKFLPLCIAYETAAIADGTIYDVEKENHDSGKEKFERLKKCIQNISPELVESLDHLIKNGLYHVDDSETKLSAASFTQEIPGYHDACIFITPEQKVADYITILHEFGHYNRAYYTASNPFSPKGTSDVEEIMSQGIQLLCYDYYNDYHEEYGSALATQTVFEKMKAVLSGFAVNEAEYRSYTTPNLTVEKLDAIWKESNDKYEGPLDGTSWTQISQVFQKPFYYIDYATSGLASFEIFVESRVDLNTGIQKYMTITALPKGTKLIEALNAAGLKNIFEKGTVAELSDALTDALCI